MPAKPESKLQKAIADRLRKEGAWVAKIHGSQFQAGIPDLLICWHGIFIAMEVKVPGRENTLTKLQATSLDAISKAGGYASVISSVDQALEVLATVREAMVETP